MTQPKKRSHDALEATTEGTEESSSRTTSPAAVHNSTASRPPLDPAITTNHNHNNHNNTTPLSERCENTTVCLPIVTGSVAVYLGLDETQTHEWTLSVQGPAGDDLSPVLQKVIFQLHPSFVQPTREIHEPPYQVTERGWGEFEAHVQLVWKEQAMEQPTLLAQTIKLYPPGATASTQSDTPVVSEHYDEIVFTNPTMAFLELLHSIAQKPSIEHLYYDPQQQQQQTQPKHEDSPNKNDDKDATNWTDAKKKKNRFSDATHVKLLLAAQQELEQQLQQTKSRWMQQDEELQAVEEALRQQQEEIRRKARSSATTTTTTKQPPSNTSATTASTHAAPKTGSSSNNAVKAK